ncbi:efflux RND transporter periplasmic adaptor subunit [Oscillospiraceae bacterium PP1C4]
MIETSEKLELAQNPPTNSLAEAEKPKQEPNRFTKKKSGKKKIIIISLVIVAIVIAVSVTMFLNKGGIPPVDSITLAKQAISNTVSVTGTVESKEAIRVYSDLGSKINTVNVKVGDRVEQGDVLAQVDTADLQLSIAQQQAVINQLEKAGSFNIKMSEKNYNDASSDLTNDMNAALEAAEQSLDRAQRELNDARLDLKDHKDDQNHADDVMNALEKKLSRARDAFKVAEKAYDKAEQENTMTPEIKETYDKAEKEYNDILGEWNTNNTEYGGELSVYSKTYRRARQDYDSALTNYEIAKKQAGRNLNTLKDSIDQTKIADDQTANKILLQKLQKQLTDSTLTAPISGTVTAVYAKVGAPGTGLMFMIENTDDLVIKTKIKEYDITSVKEGMTATVKSDATGDKEFEGKIERIYPAAIKAEDGSTKSGGNVEFQSDVAILTKDSGLRVGMNVRLNIVTAHKENVYAVPYEAVTTDEKGQQVIYIAKANAENKLIVEAMPVTTGMETDFHMEINSDSIADGIIVLTNPVGITPGSEVTLLPEGGAASGAEGAAASGDSAARG